MPAFSSRFLCQKLVFLVHAVSIYLCPLFTFISAYIFRLQGDGSGFLDKNGEKVNFVETEPEFFTEDKDKKSDETEFRDFDDGVVEEEKPENYLKFQFPKYDEFALIQKETGNVINSQVVPCKYEFTTGISCVTAFVDVMESFPVKEIQIDNAEIGLIDKKGKEIVVFDAQKNQQIEAMESVQKSEKIDECSKNSVIIESDSESTGFEHIRSVMNNLMDSYTDGFLSDGDFGGAFDIDDENENENENENMDSESELSAFEENRDLSSDEDDDMLEELKKLEEESDPQNQEGLSSDFLGEKDFNESEKPRSKDPSMSESEDSNKLESLWEHQELIEQLKMELKKVRATGLPTILEESESPKISDDLKPWKIDEFQREDCIGELHKFYRSYRERMRKFDIMNYQKMYAMG